MLRKGIEVAVTMKKRIAAIYAAACDDRVNRLAHRNSKVSELSVVARSQNRDVRSTKNHEVHLAEESAYLVKLALTRTALQHFGQYEVANRQWHRSKQ
jgi:hypothetical protein